MTEEFLRTFKKYDLEAVNQAILICGDLKADCGACQELGLDPAKVTECPNCGIHFKYISSRRMEQHPGERFQLARKLSEKRPDLELVDYSDYIKMIGKKKARDFFG